jgi:hypothetical protein
MPIMTNPNDIFYIFTQPGFFDKQDVWREPRESVAKGGATR